MANGRIVEHGDVLEVFGAPKEGVTYEFVRTVINDQIPESICEIARTEARPNRIERLKFIGSSVKKPVISDICKTAGIEVNILCATVEELQDSVMCLFILQLIGETEMLEEAEQRIDTHGVLRERLEIT